jgi:diguanylate cyclase (GGDEF)-like protein
LRTYDLFARYGGEEFIVFAADIRKEDVVAMAERIRHSISGTEIPVKCTGLVVTASLGIAPAACVNELYTAIAMADDALYRAKQEGRDRVCYSV